MTNRAHVELTNVELFNTELRSVELIKVKPSILERRHGANVLCVLGCAGCSVGVS